MRKNRCLLVVLGLLMAACVVVVVYLLPPQSGVTKGHFDRIEIGMARSEVEKILGKSTQYYRSRFLPAFHNTWEDDDSGDRARLEFDANDCVTAKQWWPNEWPDDRTVWDKLLNGFPWCEKTPRTRSPVTITR